MLRAGGCLVTLAFIAACGGASQANVPQVNGHLDPKAVAELFGCAFYTPDTSGDKEPFTATEGDCRPAGGGPVTILTFKSSRALEHWASGEEDATGGDGTAVLGTGFAIQANNTEQATVIAGQVDGTTQ